MKKNVKLVKYVLLCAISLGVTSTVFTSCKDYDDDIDNLQSQINGINTSIEELKGMIKEGKTITNVTETAEGVTITFSDNSTAFIKHGKDGKPGEDGQPGQDGGSTAAPETIYIAADPETGDWIMYYKEKKDGKYADEFSTFVLTGAKIGVTSLTYVPDNISAQLGEVVFFPVIATDYEKVTSEAGKMYEYTVLNKLNLATVYNGWVSMQYQINPNNVNENSFKVVDEFVTKKAYTTKAAGFSTLIKKNNVSPTGALNIKAQANYLTQAGADYDDPEGMESEGYANQVDMIALQVKNNIVTEKDTVVTSDYIAAKRMVVKQYEILLGLNHDKELKNAVNVFRELDGLYTNAQSADAQNTYKQNLEVKALVPFKGKTDLKQYVESYVAKFYTNTDADIKDGQYTLASLGFEDLVWKFVPEKYNQAEVDQTTGTNVNDPITYLSMTEDGVITFDQNNTAAINRQPIIKVQLWTKSGILLMSKLLKVEIVREIQGEGTPTVDDLKDVELGCEDKAGKDAAGKFTDGLFIDMDKVFNYCGMSKDEFVQTYTEFSSIAGNEFSYTITKDGADYTGANITVDVTAIETNATSGVNRIPITVKNTAEEGEYAITFVFETTSKTAKYKTVTFTDKFNVTYPKTKLVTTPSMWEGSNMVIIGEPTTEPYGAPYLMQGILENGFQEYVPSECPKATTTLHFELEGTDATTYAGIVEIVENANGKHLIQLKQDAAGVWKTIISEGKKIKVRAYAGINEAIPTSLVDKNNITIYNQSNQVVNPANVSVFEVVFKDPVLATNTPNDAWYLIDESLTTASYGRKLPIYRLFKVVELNKANNGIIWDPATEAGWWVNADGEKVGEGLRGLHELAISYSLADTENNKASVVQTNIDATAPAFTEEGVIEWLGTGDAVVSAQGQQIDVMVTIAHSWGKTELVVPVKVYPASKQAPTTLPTPGIVTNGTKY